LLKKEVADIFAKVNGGHPVVL